MKNESFDGFYNYVRQNIISDFSRQSLEKFKIYFNELIEWNAMFNLISYKNETDILYRHFCDSLYAAKAILQNAINGDKKPQDPNQIKPCKPQTVARPPILKIADLGTGSGMPGIPVKIVMPEIKLTLVESITKKCKFLENSNQKLKFDIEILNVRAEESGQNEKYRAKYDIVLSRAVSKFSPNLEISIPLLKKGGYFIVHKTKNSAQSIEEGLPSVENALKHLGGKLVETIDYKLPDNDIDYQILVFEKYKDTPAQFPRKTGIPEKKPL
ncbi:MAG: 16S rRNA (guanine(527)-N(7))-methyltransferase RsmG [Endomicrobium sp.]|jgi:16S rRNA (guanine527-N7)-methyltransferase|nr:16S rRNA (guanine(527)-N(7))-methyltransferase RsmG [Endomicrobium sp.]